MYKKYVRNLTVIVFIGLLVSACSSDKPSYTLYIKNRLDKKEKIAEFFQKGEGLEDCKTLEKKWANYSTSCEIN